MFFGSVSWRSSRLLNELLCCCVIMALSPILCAIAALCLGLSVYLCICACVTGHRHSPTSSLTPTAC